MRQLYEGFKKTVVAVSPRHMYMLPGAYCVWKEGSAAGGRAGNSTDAGE